MEIPDVAPRRGEPLAAAPSRAMEETVVQVSIGRIEVRAPSPAPLPARGARPTPAGPQLSLADYLKARAERRR